ncbi:outer membrane protein [Sphingobacterium sp. Ag1]|uniref:porin n=1 Tax=Sphingobacterium sp. Ag1 TaxID=1643451 RepID=UPI000627C59E|nr:porin [Sphingobacterium sp. Ag1]KKO90510.1 outer membrane protein [Sphingobacterium sp. Ag1]
MKKLAMLACLLAGATQLFAQQDTTQNTQLSISGYLEAYYLRDFNNPIGNTRPGFVYSHNRTNEVNINLALLKAAYETTNTRANLALGVGTYMNANYSAEPGVLKNIYEANAGVRISKKHNLWIDAGIFSSHLGFESAIGKDNWTVTRSIFADNSPYFETGAKISYTSASGKLFLSGLILNGWQRIQRVDASSLPAFGHQLVYKPTAKWTINSGSFIGSDKADSVRQMRYFHNLYAIYQMNEKLGITFGFDIGAEQKAKGSSTYNVWYTPVLIARYATTEKFSLTARGEYYNDKHGVIVSTTTDQGFQTFGYSLNADYAILPNVLWRTELRNLTNKDAIFLDRTNELVKNSLTAVTALTVSF